MPLTTTPAATWLMLAGVDAIVETTDGLARVVSRPNLAGLCRVRFPDGTTANLDTSTAAFTILPAPTGALLYLEAEYREWSGDRDLLEKDRADRKAFDESDEHAVTLLQQFATVVGLLQPGDHEARGPVCGRCLATGWLFTDPANPVWCDTCRGTGRNPNPQLDQSPVEAECGWCGAGLRRPVAAGVWQGAVGGPLNELGAWTDRCPVAPTKLHTPA
jgi:hypothetical protein